MLSRVAGYFIDSSQERVAWWVVQEGRIRFDIETTKGRQSFEARKGSYVFAPERHLHSLEVVGSEPAIRLEVTLAEAADSQTGGQQQQQS